MQGKEIFEGVNGPRVIALGHGRNLAAPSPKIRLRPNVITLEPPVQADELPTSVYENFSPAPITAVAIPSKSFRILQAVGLQQ